MRHYRLFLLTFILQLVYFLSPVAYADAQKPTVNILTWWGYLDDPGLIARTEKACDVKISHDVYYSNDEFLRRWRGSEDNYDILIFTESIYNSAAPHLPIIETPLWQEANDYNPVIKAHYFEKKIPSKCCLLCTCINRFFMEQAPRFHQSKHLISRNFLTVERTHHRID